MEVEHIYPLAKNEKTPKVIREKFLELSFKGTSKKGNKFEIPPYSMMENCSEGRYYFLERNLSHLKDIVQLGYCFDHDLNQITLEALKEYLESYGKGFREGYFSLIQNLKENELFESDNTVLVNNVFTVLFDSDRLNTGFRLKNFQSYQDEENVEKRFGVRLHYFLDHELMHESGVSGGEYYKAWEIVLKNPTLFKGLFEDFFEYEKDSAGNKENKTQEKEFKELFFDKDDYDFIIQLLIDNLFLHKGTKEWTPPDNGHKTPHKYLTALYEVLKDRKYIKRDKSNELVAVLLSKEFFKTSDKNLSLHPRKNDFEDIVRDYHFIPQKR